MTLKKFICLVLYYGIAQYLPQSTNKYFFWTRTIRRRLCSSLFDNCGNNINVEKKASFGTGVGILIGNNSGLGVNCIVNGPLSIGDNVVTYKAVDKFGYEKEVIRKIKIVVASQEFNYAEKDQIYEMIQKENRLPVLIAGLHTMSLEDKLMAVLLELITAKVDL